ncbi:copper resistance protein CopB [Sphingomonas sp. Leaf339]|uniref:copper resistance protein B n=1 Tax=Sphingomonas sp. Leaf339 TaxID=1736343 RepID=UPI0006FF5EF1|nr:copper resistance protein B [Sphingomonas sp. Leaf339]KQU55855.1 copper resistance protein CopB [Sphingomonas sp. Leaf339]
MIRALLATTAIAVTSPAFAQSMDHMHMPGMAMPAAPKAEKPKSKKATAKPVRRTPATSRKATPKASSTGHAMPDMANGCAPEHAAMGHCTPAAAPATSTNEAIPSMPGMAMSPTDSCPPEHAAMGHCKPAATAPVGTDQPAGNAPRPAAPTDSAAARFHDPAAMAASSAFMRREHGGMRFSQVIFNIAEAQVKKGRDGYRWDGEGWFGGDIHRLVMKSEGEGSFGRRLDGAEVQALYSRAIGPYFDLQGGVRQDLGRGAKLTYATIGVEGLAPYWFEVEGALFLSDKGDVLGRVEAYYDQRITQRLIAQPRLELNLAAHDMPGSRIGSGLSNAELGLRLRYEIKREFAPYVAVSWERRYGDTARYARARGDDTGGFALALGVRAWF